MKKITLKKLDEAYSNEFLKETLIANGKTPSDSNIRKLRKGLLTEKYAIENGVITEGMLSTEPVVRVIRDKDGAEKYHKYFMDKKTGRYEYGYEYQPKHYKAHVEKQHGKVYMVDDETFEKVNKNREEIFAKLKSKNSDTTK